MSETMISVSGLTKQYPGYKAVSDLSFEIQRGEIIGFLGPNGAGKTTTMRMLTGYIPASAGKISIAGLDIQENSLEVRKKIGYLPENVPLYREMTVNAYLTFNAQLKGVNKNDIPDQIQEVLESCNLLDVRYKIIDKLSKGYRQRVGLAQALIGDPEILILDEPTVGLDPKQILEIRSLIKELGKKRTVILSTHILPEVSQICNRVLIITKGTLVASGTPAELQAKMKKSEVLTVQVKCDDIEKFSEFLKGKISAIKNVKAQEENGIITAVIESDKDIRKDVTASIVSNKNFDLLEIKKQEVNLEDIFLHLTTKDAE
ncbi:MAG: ATP-binding cassette domain-containing protein [bacterium]